MRFENIACLGIAVLFPQFIALQVIAQDEAESTVQSNSEPTPEAEGSPKPRGILSIPDYTPDVWNRSALSGDWNGTRTELAQNGVQIKLSWNQYVQDVASGGRDSGTRYGGKGDYLINFDLDRMGVLPGALVTFRAESRYGESVNSESGLLLPANTDAFFPLTDEGDEDIAVTITNLLFTQYFSEHFGMYIGKLDTLSGDANEFASGRGTTQFMNSNFVFNPALALRMPYSTLGIGAAWFPNQNFTLNTSLFNTPDSSTTTGFDDFGDGATWTLEAAFQYRVGELPGGMNVGGLYSFDQNFAEISERLVFQPGQEIVIPIEDETWSVYWSGWQYLWVEDSTDAPINLADGRPDHQGVGLFARFGFADRDTNPIDWSASLGIGGRGIFPGRDHDTFGVGYFYNSLKVSQVTGAGLLDDYSQGFEAYYSLAFTPAVNLTFDTQVIDGSDAAVDTAILLGLRLGIEF